MRKKIYFHKRKKIQKQKGILCLSFPAKYFSVPLVISLEYNPLLCHQILFGILQIQSSYYRALAALWENISMSYFLGFRLLLNIRVASLWVIKIDSRINKWPKWDIPVDFWWKVQKLPFPNFWWQMYYKRIMIPTFFWQKINYVI